MSSFFARLKERKLFHWAVAYLAGAWLVLQVLDVLATPFAWPDQVLRLVTILLAIGFPGVLVVAWYHGERGSQRVSGIELLMLTGILVIAAAAMGLVARGGHDAPRADASSPGVSSPGVSSPGVSSPGVSPGVSSPGVSPGTASPGMSPAGVSPALAPAEQGSIAVLPFLDLSPAHDQEYFSDGLTEELLDALSRVPGLRVASRTSAFAFRGKDIGVDSIARALRVATVLEGSVRKAGDHVRITAQLISARTGYHLWSETYDRELKDIFAVQDAISHAIVGALALELAGGKGNAQLVKDETRDPAAHELVLRGEYFTHRNDRQSLERALESFQEAIRRDSGYARAYAGLASTYNWQAYMRYGPRERLIELARQTARQAVALDSTVPEAHYVLGNIAIQHDWDLPAGEAYMRRAMELNPGLAGPHSHYAWILMDLGRTDEALAQAKRAVELDPVSSAAVANLGSMYSYARRGQAAVEAYRTALALRPDNPVTLDNLALQLSSMSRHDEAVRSAEQAFALDSTYQFTLAALAFVYARAGRPHDAETALAALLAQPEPGPYLIATASAGIGDADRLFAALDQAVSQHDEAVLDLNVDPVFDPYRSDPRMERVIARIRAIGR